MGWPTLGKMLMKLQSLSNNDFFAKTLTKGELKLYKKYQK